MTTLSTPELNEEIDFFRHVCGWNDKDIETQLGLRHGTLAQRRHRAARRAKRATGTEVTT